ncbi:MAG: glycosyl hydrolase 108 family protein [Saprospiraceae bacterium]
MSQLTTSFFQTILKMEGGYQNHPDDSGNYACGELIGTNMGISAPALQTWWGRCPSVDDMKGLTQSQAFDFYSWYFHVNNNYAIQSQTLAELSMNNTMGSITGSAKAEQRALNRLGYNVAVDGQRGPQTVSALNDAWKKAPSAIYNQIREEWIAHLKSINKPQFLTGWLYRMDKYFPPMSGAVAGFGVAAVLIIPLLMVYGKKS